MRTKRYIRGTVGFRPKWALLTLSVALLAACGKAAPENPNKLPRVENPTLGLAIGAVPPAFSVKTEQGAEIVLERKEGEGEVKIFEEAPEVGGVNLVDMVWKWKDAYEAMPEGQFHGQVEIITPLGPGYTVRGSFQDEDGNPAEERRIFTLSPSGDKALVLVYSYPPGNNPRERMEEMFELASELESLAFQPTGPPVTEEPAAEPAPADGTTTDSAPAAELAPADADGGAADPTPAAEPATDPASADDPSAEPPPADDGSQG